jgi:hypothetical protein
MLTTIKRFRYLLLFFPVVLSGCFGSFDSGGDHIAGPYYTGWIDVHSTRNIGRRDSNDIELEVVPVYIFAVGYNDKFIVAKQHPLEGNFPNEKINTRQTKFFIIDLRQQPGQGEKGLFGPMDELKFKNLSIKLDIGTIEYNLSYPEVP